MGCLDGLNHLTPPMHKPGGYLTPLAYQDPCQRLRCAFGCASQGATEGAPQPLTTPLKGKKATTQYVKNNKFYRNKIRLDRPPDH